MQNSRATKRKGKVFRKGILSFLVIVLLLLAAYKVYHMVLPPTKIEAPQPELGRQVIVHLPDGKEVYTYEFYIKRKKGRVYYKGERNKIDLTKGKIEYKDWEGKR